MPGLMGVLVMNNRRIVNQVVVGVVAVMLVADAAAGINKIGAGRGECGTVLTPEGAAWALALQQAGAYDLPDGVALGIPYEVPLTFHVVRTSAGTGGISESQLSQALADADTAFASMGISFCLPGPTIYIDSDAFYYDIDTVEEIDALRLTDPVPNTINIYFTPNLAWEGGGLCGIASFTFDSVQGIAMNNGCTGTPENPSTFPHELGHYFDLFHTHETMFGDECVDGSNCDVAGDWMCDTPADPNLSGQVTPPPDCLYTGGESGPCPGDPPYDPDTTNLMSYSHALCRDNFSPQQDERGVATLLNLRPELVDACDCPATASPRLYVSAGALPGGDGTTWASAFEDLQYALVAAACPLSPVTEIWVAAGAYTPAPPGGARGATFRLLPGVEVYGHFAGTESSVEHNEILRTQPTRRSSAATSTMTMKPAVATPRTATTSSRAAAPTRRQSWTGSRSPRATRTGLSNTATAAECTPTAGTRRSQTARSTATVPTALAAGCTTWTPAQPWPTARSTATVPTAVAAGCTTWTPAQPWPTARSVATRATSAAGCTTT
jgi:hypothetical protein